MNLIKLRKFKRLSSLATKTFYIFMAINISLISPIAGTLSGIIGVDVVEKVSANSIQEITIGVDKDSFWAPGYITTETDRHALSIGNTWWGSWFQETYSLIKFSNLGLPANAIITYARLNFVERNNDTSNYTFEIRKVNSDWPENGNNGGISISSESYGSFTSSYAGLIMAGRSVDLSSGIYQYLQNSNFGIALVRSGGNNQYGGLICSSDNFEIDGAGVGCEAQHAPSLTIQYIVNQPPFTPAPSLPANLSEFSGNCDESSIPVSGNCRTTLSQNLTLTKVGDGDTSPGDHKTVFFKGTNTTTNTNFSYSKNVDITPGSFTNQSYSANFNDGKYTWTGYSVDKMGLNGMDGVLYNFTNDTTPPSFPTLEVLPEFTKGVGIDSNVQFEIKATSHSTDNISTQSEVGYIIQYSTDSTFATNTFTKPIQRFTATLPRFELGPKGIDEIAGTDDDITQESQYYFKVKSVDKLNNISNWSNIVSSKIDASAPTAKDVVVNPVRFSPQNISSAGSFDLLEFGYKFSEINTKLIGYEILDESYNVVYRFTETPLEITNTDKQLNYSWNGQNDAGTNINDGAYIIRPYIEDFAGNTLTIKQTDHQRLFTLDNTGVDINFSQIDNSWVNNSNLNLTGQVTDVGD